MVSLSSAINWKVANGTRVLQHPTYLLFAAKDFNSIDSSQVKAAINSALASNESADLVAYLCWLLRVKALLA